MKRKVNRSKRPKIGSHGFKVYKNTYVNVGQGVSPKLVTLLQDLWNNNESTKKMRKYVKGITIKNLSTVGRGGRWISEKCWYEHIQKYDDIDKEWHKSVFYHEVEGHAFWHFSLKWRREALTNFNKLANNMPPIDSYAKENEEKWKRWNDDKEEMNRHMEKFGEWNESEECTEEYNRIIEKQKTNGHETMTRYANEQHSILTEIIRGVHSRERFVSDEQLKPLIKAWEELHN